MQSVRPSRFRWTTFDVRTLLPADWQAQIVGVATRLGTRKVLVTRHSTSREARDDMRLPTRGVSGVVLARELPWLRRLYEGEFRDLAQLAASEPVSIMSDERFGIALNIQTGTDRYECHVDSNPIEGLLYATTHREGEGGELIVANVGEARSVEEVESDPTVVEPKAGYLLFFDGRRHSHYVRQLAEPETVRVVVAMNYYVPSCAEEVRPFDLNAHLMNDA
jgi:hypothetical protein